MTSSTGGGDWDYVVRRRDEHRDRIRRADREWPRCARAPWYVHACARSRRSRRRGRAQLSQRAELAKQADELHTVHGHVDRAELLAAGGGGAMQIERPATIAVRSADGTDEPYTWNRPFASVMSRSQPTRRRGARRHDDRRHPPTHRSGEHLGGPQWLGGATTGARSRPDPGRTRGGRRGAAPTRR